MSGKRVIIYGAGQLGKAYYGFLKSLGYGDDVEAFCDRNHCSIQRVQDKRVISYEEAKLYGCSFVVGVMNGTEAYDEIISIMIRDGFCYYDSCVDYVIKTYGLNETDIKRAYVVYYHTAFMDEYYDVAESNEYMNIFWGENTLFYDLFRMLDLSNVIELACGRGRHVHRYLDSVGHITLVDAVVDNIEYCKRRFGENNKITYYANNGFDLSELSDGVYSSLFTYDSMVHFEMMDVWNYLRESYRVLKNGGMALFHHSNNYTDYKTLFISAHSGRSFMSDRIFSYLAINAGFEIVSQKVFDWEEKSVDCLTLVKKN